MTNNYAVTSELSQQHVPANNKITTSMSLGEQNPPVDFNKLFR